MPPGYAAATRPGARALAKPQAGLLGISPCTTDAGYSYGSSSVDARDARATFIGGQPRAAQANCWHARLSLTDEGAVHGAVSAAAAVVAVAGTARPAGRVAEQRAGQSRSRRGGGWPPSPTRRMALNTNNSIFDVDSGLNGQKLLPSRQQRTARTRRWSPTGAVSLLTASPSVLTTAQGVAHEGAERFAGGAERQSRSRRSAPASLTGMVISSTARWSSS